MREHKFQILYVAFLIFKLFKDQKEQLGNMFTPNKFIPSGIKLAQTITICLNFHRVFPYVIISFPLKLMIRGILGCHSNVLAGTAVPTFAQNTFFHIIIIIIIIIINSLRTRRIFVI
jgi:hypothetical protein